jgi:hypothetical protein
MPPALMFVRAFMGSLHAARDVRAAEGAQQGPDRPEAL